MSKRVIGTLALSIIMLFSFVLTGCGNTDKQNESQQASTPIVSPSSDTASDESAVSTSEDKNKGITLELLVASSDGSNDGFLNAVKKAEEISGYKITISEYPSDQFENILRTKLATGNAGDLFYCTYGLNVMPADLYAALDGTWVDKITDTSKALCVRNSDGKVVKAPYQGESNFGVVYNKKVLEKAGVKLPMKNYEEFLAACEAIKKIGVTPVHIANKEVWTAQMWLLSSMTGYLNNHPDVVQELADNKLNPADDPTIVKMWDNLNALIDLGYVNSDYMSALIGDSEKAVATGTAAFVCLGDTQYGDFSQGYPDQVADLGMTTAPLWDDANDAFVCTNASGCFLSIPAASKHITEANDFINTMLTEPVMKEYYSVCPGPVPYNDLGFDLPINPWNEEMRDYTKTLTPLASWDNNAYNGELVLNPFWGDFHSNVQSMISGRSAKDSVNAWYKKYSEDAKAKKLSGF